MHPHDLDRLLNVTTSAIGDTEVPDSQLANHALLHTADRLLVAAEALHRHLVHDPGAAIDRHGRCSLCGRILEFPPRPRAWGDGKRGCAFLPATVVAHARWAANYLMSLPFAGKALWALRRKGSA